MEYYDSEDLPIDITHKCWEDINNGNSSLYTSIDSDGERSLFQDDSYAIPITF